jgi:hypothetical protein
LFYQKEIPIGTLRSLGSLEIESKEQM